MRTRAAKVEVMPSALVTLTAISCAGPQVGDAGDCEGLGAVEFGDRVDELERDHAHADQVGAVDPLVGLGDDGADAEQVGALGRPVARGAGAVFLAGDDDQRHSLLLVAHRRVVDRHHLARGNVAGDAALDAWDDLVLDSDVGEGAAHHHFVVAAAGAVGVEVGAGDLVLGEILAAGAVQFDRAGRG